MEILSGLKGMAFDLRLLARSLFLSLAQMPMTFASRYTQTVELA